MGPEVDIELWSSSVGSIVTVDGEIWATAAAACDWMGVDRKRINDWVRRSRAAGHVGRTEDCLKCAVGDPGFPHIDPPVRRNGVAGYRYSQLAYAERHTRRSRRGARRQVGA